MCYLCMAMKRLLLKIPRWVMSGAVLAAVLVLTLAPISGRSSSLFHIPYGDKVVHFCMFGALAAAFSLDGCRPWRAVGWRLLIAAAAVATAIGGLIEIVQGTEAIGRGRELWDFVADAAGAVAGIAVFRYFARKSLQNGEYR